MAFFILPQLTVDEFSDPIGHEQRLVNGLHSKPLQSLLDVQTEYPLPFCSRKKFFKFIYL